MWRDSVVRYAEAAWMRRMLRVPQLLWCVSGFKPFHIIWPLGFNNSRCLHCVRLTHFWIELIVQKTRLARLKIKSLRQFSLDETSTGHESQFVWLCLTSDLSRCHSFCPQGGHPQQDPCHWQDGPSILCAQVWKHEKNTSCMFYRRQYSITRHGKEYLKLQYSKLMSEQ